MQTKIILNKKQKKYILYVILFLGLCVLILFIAKQPQQDHTKPESSIVLTTSDGSSTKVALNKNQETIQISTASANHNEPFSRGDFIVWVEEQQNKSEKYIVRFHEPTKTTLYITTTGVAQNPKINTQGQVVWQEWIDETWQIFFYDGTTTEQVTKGQSSSINPDISGNNIVYVTRNETNNWQTVEYSTQTKASKIVKVGIESKFPYYYGTKLFFR